MTSQAACVSVSPGGFLKPPDPGPPIMEERRCRWCDQISLVMSLCLFSLERTQCASKGVFAAVTYRRFSGISKDPISITNQIYFWTAGKQPRLSLDRDDLS